MAEELVSPSDLKIKQQKMIKRHAVMTKGSTVEDATKYEVWQLMRWNGSISKDRTERKSTDRHTGRERETDRQTQTNRQRYTQTDQRDERVPKWKNVQSYQTGR